ncbi:hypothetical protein [Methylobacterium haplocladii]|uniref:Uncharacterized protein n=1 Tax=Methylobacterium haplocladii TaxID=1176176 RepID=A0A512INY3_9HYPH|nr:hypothetical protein [Methylobacterium haplocladii]GEO99400.1 hypothetical protein MHA02_17880 [Methylobacterium haplocladii]GJD85913.1 hypothetical protein HPGCJGGD_3808 [Methylobacterium haplocladii]GLS60252.1 hypothetical protein GCM10007887_29300 [Methylobacterium haplocladii]
MTRFFTRQQPDAARRPQGRTRVRRAAAAGRLRVARAAFDLSVLALRKAALDHVDLQDLASSALRANLNRLAERLGADA